MGFLDAFLNPTPEQSAALLGFATNFNNAIGGGNRPVNLGAAFAAGAQGMQQSRDQYQDRQRELQMLDMQAKLYGLKLQDAEGEFAGKQQQRERDARILKRLQGLPPGLPTLGDDAAPQADGQAGAGPVVSPFMRAMKAMGDSAPPAGRYGAQAYLDAATQAGLPNPGSMETSNAIIDRVNRLGETPDVAARALSGGGQPTQAPGMTGQGPAPGPASVFAAGDGAQFPATATLMRGLSGLPKLQDSAAAQAGQQLPPLPPTMRQGGAAPRQNLTQAYVDRIMQQADIYASEGDHEKAKALIQEAQKWRPKYANDFRQATGDDGKLRNYMVADDGTWMDTGLGVKPDLVGVDLGGTYEFVDKNNLQPGRVFQKTQTPNSRAEDARYGRRGAAGGSADASLDADTLDMMADQALRGDTSVFKNLGRGAQGSANLVELRSRITQKAKALGISGADLAAITADYGGLATGMRVSANISARVENAISEARELAPLAITAGRDVARAGLLPFGKAQVMFDTQTNDPALKKFAAANVGFVQAYAGAMARGQKPTVHDKEHAEKLISEATSQKAYEAVMGQLMLEMDAASRAPQKVREHLRNEIGGRGGAGHNTPTVPNPMAPAPAGKFSVTAPNGKTYDFPDAKSLANFKLSTGIK